MVRRGRQKEMVLPGWGNGCCSHHTGCGTLCCGPAKRNTLCPSASLLLLLKALLLRTRLSLVGMVSSCALAKLSANSASIFSCFDMDKD